MRVVPFLLLAPLVLWGCKDSDVKRGSAGSQIVTPYYQGIQCGRGERTAQITWIRNETERQAAFKRILRTSLSAEPLPEVDFDDYALVLIELGQRPTAGYQLRLSSQRMVMDKGDGLILFDVDQPGAYAAQVVTSPCLIVSVPRGDFKAVRAQSADNKIRVQTAVR